MSAPRWTSCSSPRTSPADIWGTQEADGPGLLEAKQKLASWQLNKRRNDSHELSLKSSPLTAAGSDSGRKAGGRSAVLPAQLSAVTVPGAAQVRHLDECKVSLEHCELRSLTAARSRAPDSEPAIASRSEPPPALCSWAVPRDTSSSALSQISSLSLLPASGSLSELGIRHRPLLLNTEIRTGAGEELTRTELRLPRAHPFG
ncbi:hypothetical protein Anapl_16646 [Anas platyrhynchos]|uniref:Uncharacterized protein n=1 Tax=Anas platyrhynchos TaxID=8839 RepID=R0LR92_ANAPL|nr:hypothetical protein Anapl_16646 [Anas platyrhynchos]